LNIPKFFTNNIKSYLIKNDEFNHLKNVLRKNIGDKVEIIDGKGNLVKGYIKDFKRNSAIIHPKKMIKENQRPFTINVYIALLPSNKLNFIVQKLAEIGVSRIYFFPSERSKNNAIKNKRKKIKKLKKSAISALKQSGNLFLPGFEIYDEFEQILNSKEKTKILLSQNGKYLIKSDMSDFFNRPNVSLTIGPEGGFTSEEKQKFLKNNYLTFKINNNILRSETAAICSTSLIKYILESQCSLKDKK